jgi:hypothetical protein
MPYRKLIVILAALVLSTPLFADDGEGPEAFSIIVGPRVGVSGTIAVPEVFSSSVSALYPSGTYFPVLTLFGLTVEQRILLGSTRSHFAFQEVVLVGGLEQGIALPEGAVLIGYRDYSGFEIGIGPILHLAGVGVVAAAGYTFSFKGMFVPVDLSVIIPNAGRPASVALTTGFNFQISRRESKVSRTSQDAQKPPEAPGSSGAQGSP